MPDHLSLKQASELLGISKQTLVVLCRRGLIKGAYTVGAGDVRVWVIPPGHDGKPERIAGKRGPKARSETCPGRAGKRED